MKVPLRLTKIMTAQRKFRNDKIILLLRRSLRATRMLSVVQIRGQKEPRKTPLFKMKR